MRILQSICLLIQFTVMPAVAVAQRASPQQSDVVGITLNHHLYKKVSSAELTFDLAHPAQNPAAARVGMRIFSSFEYSDNTIMGGHGTCGMLFPDEMDWSPKAALYQKKQSVLSMKRATLLACFPNAKSYMRFGSGCPHNWWTGSPCHIIVAGTVRDPKQFEISALFNARRYGVVANYIEVEYMRKIDTNSQDQIRMIKDGILELRNMYEFTEK